MISSLSEWAAVVHRNAVDKGWWPAESGESTEKPNIPERLCLMHSEISEALEEYRIGDDMKTVRYDVNGKPEGFVVELADVLIRVLDLAGHLGMDVDKVMMEKHMYNKNRPYRHGNKRA